MKKLIFFLFLFSASYSFSQVKVGSNGNIIATGIYPVANNNDLKAGIHDVQTITDRNSIPANFRRLGMLAYVIDSLKYYQLKEGITNSDWVEFISGSASIAIDTTYVQLPLYVDSSSGRRVLKILHDDGLISGGIVSYSTVGLIYDVSAAVFYLNGTLYTTPTMQVTLSAADATYATQYLFVVDTTGVATFLRGDPAALPLAPQIDEGSQVALTSGITIDAGATTPPVNIDLVYDENVETWTTFASANMTASFGNTDNPYHGIRSIFVSSYQTGSYISFTKASQVTTQDEVLKFYFYSNGKYNNKLRVGFKNGTTYIGNSIYVTDINPNDSNRYQAIAIPLSRFNIPSGSAFNKIIFSNVGYDTSDTKGYYIDYVQLQSGIPNIPPSGGCDSCLSTIVKTADSAYFKRVNGDTAGVIALGGGSGGIQSVVAGTNVTVDDTDPLNPIVNASEGSGNDTAIVHVDSVVGHPNWIIYKHSNRSIPPDTSKFNLPVTLVSLTKNIARDSIIALFSDGSQMDVKDSVGSGGGSSSLSSLTAATAPNTINNGGLNKQEWQWNTLDTTTAFKLSSNAAGTTTGGGSQKLLEVTLSGVNARSFKTTYSTYITNTHTGTSATNVALYAEASGGSINNAAQFVGNVSITNTIGGVSAPVYMLDVRGSIGTTNVNTGTINPYSGGTSTTLTGFLLLSQGVNVPSYTGINYNYGRASAIGYAAIGNDVISTSADTSILRINGNSTLKKVGLSGQNVQISDSSVVDASKYNYNTNAILDLSSTTKAFLPPRLTTTQRDAMVLTGVGYGTSDASHGSYTAGVYVNVALSGGTGSGALARAEFAGSSLARFIITTPGSGYSIGDVLTFTIPSTGTGACSLTITQLTGVPGMMIYNKTTGKLNLLNNSRVWEAVTSL